MQLRLVVLLVAVLTSACSSPQPAPGPVVSSRASAASGAPDPGASRVPGPGAPESPGPGAPQEPDLGAPEVLAKGLDVPWGLAFLPGGDALIAERATGRILRLPAAGGPPSEVTVVPGVTARGEGGLLGLAVPPTFPQDPWVYAYLTAADDNRIIRFPLDGAAAGEPEVVFAGIARAGNHNGGRIAFGPDGMLYAGTGDATDPARAQDPAGPNGKILRLTPDGAPAPGNPTAGSPVYSLGHRNVQGLAWDSTGRLFAAEFGQNRLDEINLIEPGHNYGWPEVEGTGGGDRYTDPLVTWPTDDASPSGIAIAGNTLYVAALRGERLWTVPLDGERLGAPAAELQGSYGRLRTVALAPDGALWLTTSNRDGRGAPGRDDDMILRFPAARTR